MQKKNVVIVGGGFGGIQVAKSVGNDPNFSVTLVDRRNYHLFQPLLYQVAMAGLSATDIAVPIRSMLSKFRNISTILGEVDLIDFENQKIRCIRDEIPYDYLILACGAKHSYFGKEDWEPFAPGLKTIEQAIEIRRRVLIAFEKAEKELDDNERKKLLNFVVVGGGPTGVELAGAIGEISKYTLSKDFKNIKPSNANILLIEAGERILSGFDPFRSKKAEKCLKKLGVQVLTHSKVTSINDSGVQIGEEFIETRTVLWAAGVQPSSLNSNLITKKDRVGRIKVLSDLSIEEHSNVFVIGDQAYVESDGKPLPGIAPVAIQQGKFIGKVLKADIKKVDRPVFNYFDKGQMATIGRKMAVLEVGKIKLWGSIAWLAWLVVHIYFLIGFKNRFFVFIQWFWHYVSYSRGARLIIGRNWKSYGKSK